MAELTPEAAKVLKELGVREEDLNPEILAKMAKRPGYPQVIPTLVLDRLKRYFTAAPAEVLSRAVPAFGGKSAVQAVADGDRTWDAVLAHYDDLFRWDYRG